MPSRANVVQSFLDMFADAQYLEVGVNQGQTFHALRAGRKVAVDPRFAFDNQVRQPGAIYHEVTSDEYFGSIYDGCKFDVIYLDGLHTFEQTLKDLMSAQLVLREEGIIVIDNVLPNSFDASLPDLSQVFELRSRTRELGFLWETDGSWMGDVYKLIFFIDSFMQQFSFATVADNHGQSVLWRKPRRADDLPEADFKAVSCLDFRDTVLRRTVFRLRPLDVIVAEVASCRSCSLRVSPPDPPRLIPFPPETLIATAEIPSQALPMPSVSYPERMPELIRSFQAAVWGTTRGRKTVTAFKLKDVCVLGQGVIFDRKGEIYGGTTIKMTTAEIALAAQSFQAATVGGPMMRHSGPHLLCGQAGLPNYGHWMAEILPTIFFMQQQAPAEPWTAYVPQMFPSTATIVRDSMERLGVGPSRRIEGDGQPVWFDELIVVSGLSHHGHFLLPVTSECLQRMADGIEPDGDEKVWISRLGQTRALDCEAELSTRLSALGWRVLIPGDMTLEAQIAACKGARVMAGVDGAGLTNMAFMPAGGRVVSFTPAQMPDTFFYELAVNGGLSYHDFRCLTSEPAEGDIAWNVTLNLSADEVVEIIG